MKKTLLILPLALLLCVTGCFGNTLVMTAGGYGLGFHVNPTNVTAAVGRFDFNIVDSELVNEKLEIAFSQDGTSSLAEIFDIDTGLFGNGEQDAAIAYSSVMQLKLTPILEFPPEEEQPE